MSTLDSVIRLRMIATNAIDRYANQLEQAQTVLNAYGEAILLRYARRMYAAGGAPLPQFSGKCQLIALLIHGAQVVLMRRVESTPTSVTNLAESEARIERVARTTFEGWMSEFRGWHRVDSTEQFAVR